jgi:hypothetical protein
VTLVTGIDRSRFNGFIKKTAETVASVDRVSYSTFLKRGANEIRILIAATQA